MKKFTILTLMLLAFSLNSYAASFTIKISGASYSPNLLSVNIGDEVIISASGAHPLVQVSKATWFANKTTQMPGGWGEQTSNYTFNATVADTIYFLCAVHGPGGMKGRIIVLPSIGVNDQSIESVETVSIYPNPVSSTATLKMDNIANNNISIGLYDYTGQKIENIEAISNGISQYKFDVSKFISGNYVFVITDGTKQIVKQFVILK